MVTALGYLLTICGFLFVSVGGDDSAASSHLKPFGYGDYKPMDEVQGFLPVKQFFEEYVIPNKPVVMRGANKIWPGYERWQSDDYFKAVAPQEPFIVSMDVKRGTPDKPTDYVDFKDFLQKYNSSNRRMVEFTPPFLRNDILVPTSLDCGEITKGEVLMGNKIWFGAQYTTSVVHKDAADNINCLVYGVKNYTVLAPKYADNVFMDRPDGLYSTMDVDEVDAEKYPGLDTVQYQLTELHGGDCVFIPYKWIHQVRSYGRNIAINIWWNHWKNTEINLAKCTETEEKKAITEAKFVGWGDFETRTEGVLEHARDLIAMSHVLKPVTYPRWVGIFTNGLHLADENPMEVLRYIDTDIKKALRESFLLVDHNTNKRITPDEFDEMTEEQTTKFADAVKYVLKVTRERSVAHQDKDKNRKRAEIEIKGEETEKEKQVKETEQADQPKHDEF